MLPDFICVGPGRAGTSWLYEIFLAHPDICMAKDIKETQFFNANFHRGTEWYEKFFEYCSASSILGEISNRYIFDPEVPNRIHSVIGSPKILICMRNPYERIKSVYSFKLREGQLDCSFGEALVSMPELIDENRYYSMIKPYYDTFGPDNIFFIFFEDIAARPLYLCQKLFAFLGVDETFAPEVVNKKINSAIVPRCPGVSGLTKGVANVLRGMELHRPLTWAKRQGWIKSMFFRPVDLNNEIVLAREERALIDPVVVPEIKMLEDLIGRSLSSWVD